MKARAQIPAIPKRNASSDQLKLLVDMEFPSSREGVVQAYPVKLSGMRWFSIYPATWTKLLRLILKILEQ